MKGMYAESRKLEEKVLEVILVLLGTDHPSTLDIMSNLAMTAKAQGDLEAARRFGEQSLELSTRLRGPGDPFTVKLTRSLASICHLQGAPPKARELQERALEMHRSLVVQDDEEGVLAILAELLAIVRRVAMQWNAQAPGGGAGSKSPAAGRRKRASRNAQGDWADLAQTMLAARAEPLEIRKAFEELVELSVHVHGKEHPDTLSLMAGLGQAMFAQGDLVEARKIQEWVLQTSRRVRGDQHPDTLGIMVTFGVTVKALGEVSLARKLQEEAVAGLMLAAARRTAARS